MKYNITSKFHLAPRQQNHPCKQNKNNKPKQKHRPQSFQQCFQKKPVWGKGGERWGRPQQSFPGLRFYNSCIFPPLPRADWITPIHSSKMSVWEGSWVWCWNPKLRLLRVSLLSTSASLTAHSSCECQLQTLPASNSPYAGSTDKTGRVRGMSSVRTGNLKNPFKALGPYPQEIDASLPIEFTPTSQCRKAEKSQINQRHQARELSDKRYWGKTQKSLFWQPSNFFQWSTEMLTKG